MRRRAWIDADDHGQYGKSILLPQSGETALDKEKRPMLNRTCKFFVTVIAFGALNLAVHSSSQAGVIQFSAPLVTANEMVVPGLGPIPLPLA